MKKIIITLLVLIQSGTLFSQRTLTLEASKHLALQNNCRLKNSTLEAEAAHQTRRAAFTKYFPSVSAGGMMWSAQKNLMEKETQGGNLPVYDGNPASLFTATQFAYLPGGSIGLMRKGAVGQIQAVQPVFAGGRIINGNILASLGEDVAELKGTIANNEVMLKTEEEYWLVVSLTEKKKTIERYDALLASLQKQVDDAYKSGIVMKNDLLKVKLKRNEMLLNKSKLENGIALASMAFCQHIGIPYDSTLVLNDTLTTGGIPESYYVDHSAALATRAEYGLLKAMVRSEEVQTRMKIGDYLPQVGVGVSGMSMKFDDGKARTFGMVFGTLSIPISDWWGAAHTLSERKVKEEMAENTMKDNAELLLLQMEKSRQDLSDAYKQVLLSEEAKAQAEENLKVNDDSYRNGVSSVSDLLEAQALVQQTVDHFTEAKSNYLMKKIMYLQATGR